MQLRNYKMKEYVICLRENDQTLILNDGEWCHLVEEATFFNLNQAEEIISFYKRFNPLIFNKQSNKCFIMKVMEEEDK